MASYIPQVTDYIPDYQPFQPDYNFLNNVLQRKQNQYDTNYKALSQTYGTLLNSPMMRQDNIEKRNQYFKLIDQDIKRISGLDLSLQQNVDAANSVFDSFSQNKDLVQDIVYTKKFNQELENAESYKLLCGDPTKCDGQYWDTGVNAIKLRAEEYMKASKEEAMKMSPGKFVPFVNVPEKAVSYLNNLLSKGGDNGFGVSAVTMSSNGMYQMTMKNGSLLAVPYKDLLLNVFANDSRIQDMYETQAYVRRKTWVQSRAKELGGDELKAEDEYFSTVDTFIQEARIKAEKAREEELAKKNRKNLIEKTIKTKGTTGNDDVANDYVSASLDVALSAAAKKHAEKSEGIANSIFFVGDNRDAKRQRVDAITANSLMSKEIGDSAIRAALMTGGISKIEADPYYKAQFEADLARRNTLANTQLSYDLARRNQREKQIFDYTIKQIEAEEKGRGSIYSKSNNPDVTDQNVGASGAVDKLNEMNSFVKTGTGAGELQTKFLGGYTDQLLGIVGTSKDPAEVSYAKQTLKNIYNENYDVNRGEFVDEKGRKISDYNLLLSNPQFGQSNTKKFFANAQTAAKYNSSILSHADFLKGEGKALLNDYAIQNEVRELGNAQWRKNNRIVKREVLEQGIGDSRVKLGWSIYFRPDGSNLTKGEFINKYKQEIKETLGSDISDRAAEGIYNDVASLYRKGYNESKGVDSVYNLPGLSKKAGYLNSMKQITYTVVPGEVDSPGMRGLISAKRASDQDQFTKYGFGIAGTADDVSDENQAALAQQGINAFLNAINFASTDAEVESKIGSVSYQPIGLSDPSYQRVTIKFNQDFINQNKGKGTSTANKTWADDPRVSEGISFYFKTKNHEFAKLTAHKPIDILLAHKDKTIEVPRAGRITLSKMDENGVIHASGILNKVVDGKLVEDDPIYNFPYPATKSGQSIYEGWEYYLNKIAEQNEAALKNQNYISNPTDVLKYQQIFGQEPEQDLTQILLSKFESNMKAFGIE